MGIILEIEKGSWFRAQYQEEREEIKKINQVKENINFLNKNISAIEVLSTQVFIGRDRTNHIILDSINASKKHCVIFYKLGNWYVQDLDSTYGTMVEKGAKILITKIKKGPVKLENGDRILIGDETVLKVSFPGK